MVVEWAALLQEVQIPELSPGERYVAPLDAPITSDSDIVGMYVIAVVDPLRANGDIQKIGVRIP